MWGNGDERRAEEAEHVNRRHSGLFKANGGEIDELKHVEILSHFSSNSTSYLHNYQIQ